MKSSENINELIAALAKARKKIKAPVKSSENPYFKSRYADLAECLECSYEALSDNGIVIIQMPKMTDGKVIVETFIGHSSGQWILEELALTPIKQDPQSCGSAITYARRYSIQAFLNIAPESEDDDGNKASQKPTSECQIGPSPQKKDSTNQSTPKVISDPQRKKFYATYKKAGHSDSDIREWLNLQYGITSSKEIPVNLFDKILALADSRPGELQEYLTALRQGRLQREKNEEKTNGSKESQA